jgi:hypothetical protein
MKKLRGRKYEKIENIFKPEQNITSKYLFVMTSILRTRFFGKKVTFEQKPVVSTGHYYYDLKQGFRSNILLENAGIDSTSKIVLS